MTQTLSPPPSISQPIALANGLIAREWYRWLYTLAQQAFTASGGGSGGGAEIAVTVGASPFVYTASAPGVAILSGGGITSLALARSGPWRAIGAFRAPVPMNAGDTLQIAWTQAAPTMFFFPR